MVNDFIEIPFAYEVLLLLLLGKVLIRSNVIGIGETRRVLHNALVGGAASSVRVINLPDDALVLLV